SSSPNTPKTSLKYEDCLYLNIFVPLDVNFSSPLGSPLPVMVWIHGGDFIAGSASKPLYDGRFISNLTHTVVVSLEYRLGAFGFLVSGKDLHSSAAGNYGILDQQAALLWVQQNIPVFGGDPSKVTLFGESAGAQSVSLHLMIQSSQPLFKQAVLQRTIGSGSAWLLICAWPRGATGGQEVTLLDILSIQSQFTVQWSLNLSLHTYPLLLFIKGTSPESAQISTIKIYLLSDQLSLFLPSPQIVTDYIFLCPSRRSARAGTAAGSKVWMYVFDHVASDHRVWSGLTFCYQHACHGAELPFLFDSASVANFTLSMPEKLLSNRMLCYWGAFAHTGDPSSRAQQTTFCREQRLPVWPRYSDTSSCSNYSSINRQLLERKCYFYFLSPATAMSAHQFLKTATISLSSIAQQYEMHLWPKPHHFPLNMRKDAERQVALFGVNLGKDEFAQVEKYFNLSETCTPILKLYDTSS
uniref:Carboxylic ester hydrolase n=1 Tax=Sander lucioperca TaxID=283035 RepID=A0A8C9Y0Y9_SANLU